MERLPEEVDVLVIGSGIAGLSFALESADLGRVCILTKKERAASNTNYARGGIAAVMGADDDPEFHLRDTLRCGAGLCRRTAVEVLVREGPARVRELRDRGVAFEVKGETFSLGREGGHSRRRIVHAGDRTGREIESVLLARVDDHPSMGIFDDHFVEDLLLTGEGSETRCCGAQVIAEATGERHRIRSRITLLASGGLGRIYRNTTNPAIATGDGVAMAYRAGAEIVNMEFIQFHPTALHPVEDPAFLISEVVRGEGAVLRRIDGEPFMDGRHPSSSLASRDVVAREIQRVLRESGDDHVVLDIGPVPREIAETRFASTLEGCRERGIRPFRDGIPVVPAAHYSCGGISTDLDARTGLPGLLALGEVACTGVHGANRLASNSLLEAVVFGRRAATWTREALLTDTAPRGGESRLPPPIGSLPREQAELPTPLATEVRTRGMGALRELMWDRAGIVRERSQLEELEPALEAALVAADSAAPPHSWSLEEAELRNALLVGLLVVRSALYRSESRGLHALIEHPWKDNEHYLHETVLTRRGAEPP